MAQKEEKNLDEIANFTERQKEAEAAAVNHKYVLYGGAMGGGKSYWLRWMDLKFLLHFARDLGIRGVRVGLFCEDYPSLKDRQISKIQYEFPPWLGTLNKAEHEYTLKPEFGSGVLCFRNLDDPSRYQSAEFAVISIDELTKNNKQVFDFLRTRLRWPGIDGVRFVAGTNPGGIGHDWVRKMWMHNEFEEGEQEQDEFVYVPAKAIDNPHLMPGYFTSLAGLPPDMKRAYLEGDWDLFEGQYFTEWRREKHVIPAFPIPDTWKRFRSIDFGRAAPFCCLWFAIDYDGRVYCYREYYEKGKDVDRNTRNVLKLSQGEKYEYTVIDASTFSKTGHGETIAQIMQREGIPVIPSSKDRIAGWQVVHQYLYWDEVTTPKLMFFDNCSNAIRTIPTMIHDDLHPEDLDTNTEDHAPDAVRYFLQTLRGRKGEVPLSAIEKRLLERKKPGSFVDRMKDFYANK